jgi:tetrahydromethanopterin S-methyltransferase subunit D
LIINFGVKENIESFTIEEALNAIIMIWILSLIPTFVVIYGISFTKKATQHLQKTLTLEEGNA